MANNNEFVEVDTMAAGTADDVTVDNTDILVTLSGLLPKTFTLGAILTACKRIITPDTIAVDGGSLTEALDAVNEAIVDINDDITTIHTANANQDSVMTALADKDTQHDTAIENINTSITNLTTASSTHVTSVGNDW